MKSVGFIIGMVMLVQFVNAMDMVLVMPLGPDLAEALDFPTSKVAWLSSSYTYAAAITALTLARFFDRFDRKHLLLMSLSGLFFGTLACGLATSLESMMVARVVAGIFGGPAVALGISIVADKVPPQERGKAMALVMAGFPLSAIFGIPIGLFIADVLAWQWAFYLLSALILIVLSLIYFFMPNLREHLDSGEKSSFSPLDLFTKPVMGLGTLATAAMLFPAFLVIPHISTILQLNFGFPRENLSFLYLAAGICNLVVMQLSGRISDRVGAFKTTFVIALVFATNLLIWLILALPMPYVLGYVIFFACFSAYMVPLSALTTKIPKPQERAGYGAMQSFMQHVGAGSGAAVSYFLVVQTPSGALDHLDRLAWVSGGAVFLIPTLAWVITRMLAKQAPTALPQAAE